LAASEPALGALPHWASVNDRGIKAERRGSQRKRRDWRARECV
jgi:hypothetical protein